jgi:hypothetical protein
MAPDQVLQAAERVGVQLGYKVQPRAGMVVASQSFQSAMKESFGTAWPAKITVKVTPKGDGANASVAVTNFGLGPMQSGHVKKHLQRFLQSLEAAVEEDGLALPPQPRGDDEKYCSRCGSVIKLESRFCPNCGAGVQA